MDVPLHWGVAYEAATAAQLGKGACVREVVGGARKQSGDVLLC